MKPIVTLIGYRGTGKSTIAPRLAARLNWDHLDSDAEIERTAGCSIAEIFRRFGEADFRRRESETIAAVLRDRGHLVLSVGGGAIIDATTRTKLKVAGPVVWLRASVDNILKRIHQDASSPLQRPRLTADADERSEVTSVLAERTPLYADAATLVVDTDGLECDDVTDAVYQRVTEALSGDSP